MFFSFHFFQDAALCIHSVCTQVSDKGLEEGCLARTALSYFLARLSLRHFVQGASMNNLKENHLVEMKIT